MIHCINLCERETMGSMLFGLGQIGWVEGVIILVVVLVLFGGKKIPQLARDLGTGIREFRKSISGAAGEISEAAHMDEDYQEDTKSKTRKKTKKS